MANNLSANDFQLGVQVIPKTETLDAEFKKISQTKSINVDVKIDGQSFKNVNKVVETYSNNLGTTQQKIRILNQENEELYSKLNKITNKFKPFNQEVKESSQNLSETAKTAKQASGSITNLGDSTSKTATKAKSLGQSFGDIVTKVGKFYLATKPIQMMQQAFDEAIETVKEFDDAMTDLRKVSDLDGEALTDYTIKLGELGEAVYRSRTEMTEAAVLFKQTGASDEDAAKLAQLANLYMNVADNEVTAADASAYITSQMKAFKITANDAITILDKTNEVSNQFAVSSSDISRALTTSSASLAVYGNDINDTIALVTAGTEIMTGKAQQVGRGLRSIGANIAALASGAGELEFQVNGATKTISLINEETGDMIDTFEALSRIHEYWDEMTASEQAALATTLAGKTQLDVFSSVLSNFNTAIEANTVAVESNGSAWEENNKRADSISAKLNLLKSQFQELVLGKGGLQEFAKNLLDVGIAMLKFANSDVGQVIIKTTLLTTALLTAHKALTLFVNTNFGTAITMLGQAMLEFAMQTATAGDVLAGFNILIETLNINPTMLALTAFVGTVVAITAAYKKLNPTLDEQVSKLEEVKSSYEETQSTLSGLETSLENVRKQIDDNNTDDLTITDEEQLQLLKEQEASLEAQIILQKELAEQRKKEVTQQAVKTLTTEDTDKGRPSIKGTAGGYQIEKYTATDSLKYYTTEVARSQSIINGYLDKKKELEEANQQESEEYKNLANNIDAEITVRDNASAKATEYADIVQKATDGADENNEVIKDGVSAYKYYTDTLKATTDKNGNLKYSFNDVEKGEEGVTDGADETAKALEKLREEAEKLMETFDFNGLTISGLQKAFTTLKQTQDELNSVNGLTMSTYEELMSLGTDYLNYLFDEEGYLRNTADAQRELYYAKIDQLALDEVQNILDVAKAYSDGTITLDEYNKTLHETNALTWENAYAQLASLNLSTDQTSELYNRIQQYQKWAESAKANTKIQKNLGSAVKGTTKDLQDQKDALNDLKDKYEKAFNYIKDKLEDEKDKAVQPIKDRIDALKKQQEAEEKYWEKKIKQLKDENDEIEDQIALQEKQEALAQAKAKKVMVLKDNKWQYVSDDAEVTKATDELAELERQQKYEKELADLEDKKDKAKENYDQQIADLEEYEKQVEKYYDDQIQKIEDYLNQYEDLQGQKLAKDLLGIDTEKDNWATSLKNLEAYVNEYNKILAQLDTLDGKKRTATTVSTGGASFSGGSNTIFDQKKPKGYTVFKVYGSYDNKKQADSQTTAMKRTNPKVYTTEYNGQYVVAEDVGKYVNYGMASNAIGALQKNSRHKQYGYLPYYAKGISEVKDNQFAITGENPNKELVIGSKLNGSLTKLSKGSGVVNAKSTKTLAGLINSLGGLALNSLGEPNLNEASSHNQSTSISIGNISLPNVTNGQDFVDFMQNFNNDMIQKSYLLG